MSYFAPISSCPHGQAKQQWLQQFLELPNGIPSHDIFARVLARIDPEQFQQCFLNWMKSINNITEGEVIAVDGKVLKHSYDKGADKGAIHMVSAWFGYLIFHREDLWQSDTDPSYSFDTDD